MIETVLTIILLSFINPADPTGKTMYPSGIKDVDNFVFSAPPSSKYPDLVLSMPIYDEENTQVQPGIYEVRLSENKDKILLLQSLEIKAKFPIVQAVKLEKKCLVPTVSFKTMGANQAFIIYKYDDIEIYAFLYK